MSKIYVNAKNIIGKMKIMHSVNNVPVGDSVRNAEGMSNYKYFRDAHIPYCRSHDASFYEGYCGEFIVDVHRIFRNFDADVNDENAYDFEYTDKYVLAAENVGAKVFYRLGASIEHHKKVGTIPPKDYLKWAKICEHIILHYNEGWNNGFHYNMEYWEIWNEANCRNADGTNPCWQGTMEEFYEFFIVVYKYLKDKFPNLKIGGPALCNCRDDKFNHEFFTLLKENNLTLDFFSFHGYYKIPSRYIEEGEHAYELLKEYGCEDKTLLILNEWNYIRGWTGERFTHSMYAIRGLKGSSYIAGTMISGQNSKINHMMYYDARPCDFNGMFDPVFKTPLKGYYPFLMYGELYNLGNQIEAKSDDDTVYVISSKDDNEIGIMITYFDDDDEAIKNKTIDIYIDGLENEGDKKIQYYILDENHDMELYREDITSANCLHTYLDTSIYSTWFIRITK